MFARKIKRQQSLRYCLDQAADLARSLGAN